MSVYRSDVLNDNIANLEGALNRLENFDAYETEEYRNIRSALLKAHAEYDELMNGPDRFLLQREWLERKLEETF
jgi:hypothetical protein